MLTCESQTPGDRQLFRWKERRSRSNIRSLRPGIAPPGKLRLTNVQSNTNNDNNNNPTEIVTNHWCGRELIWDLNSLAKSVLIDDEHIKALAVSRLPRIDDVSPHLLQSFVARIQGLSCFHHKKFLSNLSGVSLCRRALFVRQSRISLSRQRRSLRCQRSRSGRSCPWSGRRPGLKMIGLERCRWEEM